MAWCIKCTGFILYIADTSLIFS